jgi:Tfp pilus assembly protein PilX
MVARPKASERGFALILAILALALLTVLGLSLAATTSMEVQIAANQKPGSRSAAPRCAR